MIVGVGEGESIDKHILLNPLRVDSFVLYQECFKYTSKFEYQLPGDGYYSVIEGKFFEATVLYFKYFRATKGGANEIYGAYSKTEKIYLLSLTAKYSKQIADGHS